MPFCGKPSEERFLENRPQDHPGMVSYEDSDKTVPEKVVIFGGPHRKQLDETFDGVNLNIHQCAAINVVSSPHINTYPFIYV